MTRDELIINNQALITLVLKKLNLTSRFDELFDVGLIGLTKAANKFDTNKGYKFSTYASRCISNEILMCFRKKQLSTISLETQISDNLRIQDTLTDNYDFTEDIAKKDIIKQIYNNLNILSHLEKECLIRYYGLYNVEEQKQINIARDLGISKDYCSRLVNRAINKLKGNLKA